MTVRKQTLLALLLAVTFSFSGQVMAQDMPNWEIVGTNIEKGTCEDRWDLFWPFAKEGNLDARAHLLFLLAPALHNDMLYAPGRSGDNVSQLRDIAIMAAHSLGYHHKKPEVNEHYAGIIDQFLINTPAVKWGNGKFRNCLIKKGLIAECAQVAVEEKIVPSFETYVAEIDALTAQGYKATCSYAPPEPQIIEPEEKLPHRKQGYK